MTDIDPEIEAMALGICSKIDDGQICTRSCPHCRDCATAARNASRQWMRKNGDVARAIRCFDIYDRVHGEIEDGKTWDQIDSGLRDPQPSYAHWQGYMQQSLLNCLRSFILTIKDTP